MSFLLENLEDWKHKNKTRNTDDALCYLILQNCNKNIVKALDLNDVNRDVE